MTRTLPLYRKQNAWVFDDDEKGIEGEPFVEGSSEIIMWASLYLIGREPTELIFSDTEKLSLSMKLLETEGRWSKYYSNSLGMVGWLCPVLYEYFHSPPSIIYFILY